MVQSGSVALALANSNRGIGFSTLVSSGNEAVLDTVDYIEHFLQDDDTRVIIAFLEGIRRPEAFQKACKRAAEIGKPIIVLKVGRSELARRTVVSHTGALAGADAVHDAFFEKTGGDSGRRPGPADGNRRAVFMSGGSAAPGQPGRHAHRIRRGDRVDRRPGTEPFHYLSAPFSRGPTP